MTADTPITINRPIPEWQPGEGLVFHPDRGIQFSGKEFRKIIRKHNILENVIRFEHWSDYGHREAYSHSLKAALIRGRKFISINELGYALDSDVNHLYNK